MIGEPLAHYQILRELGRGGMGKVYLAEDTRLRRKVALKLLPPELASDSRRWTRFEREALAVAAINHPNIVTIYSVEQDDDQLFYTMEYVEGSSLREHVRATGLDLELLVRCGSATADALHAAHRAGVVHRDLKPDNIMLTADGVIKILDFGIAKLRVAVEDTGVGADELPTLAATREGEVLGTVPYMSPEQVQGKSIDHRSDIFSLGIVLYELATGQRPFQGDSAADVVSSLLRDYPRPVTDLNPKLPTRYWLIVEHCLEKRRSRRYDDAASVASDLRGLDSANGVETAFEIPQSGFGRRATSSIAVLPFVNQTNDPSQEYFADGLADDLINALSRIPDLRVAARTSTFAMKGKDLTVQQIAHDLHVDTVLEGTVRRSGDRLRITTQLVHAADGYPLWSERYDRELEDVFELQDEIARTITDTLELQLGGQPDEVLHQGGTRDLDAYQEYLRGRFHWNRRDGTGLQKAMGHFQKAIEADPTYALAYAGLADAYNILAFYNYVPPSDGFARGEAAAKQALKIDGRLAEAHASLGWVAAFHEWDWTKAEKMYLEAIRLNPSYGTAHLWYCFLLGLLGRTRQSREQLAIAQRLEPLSIITKGGASWLMFHTRDYERGAREAKETLALEPDFGPAFAFLGWHRAMSGRHEDAIVAWGEAVERLNNLSLARSMLGYAHAQAGHRDEAEEMYAALLESTAEEYVTPYYAAVFADALDRRDEAFEWLQRGLEERNSFMPFLGVDPLFDDLRQDDRFAAILEQVGLSEIEFGR